MTDSERNIMKAHGDYLQSLAEVGSIVCHGPVDDPKGGSGLSIFSAKDQTEVERLTAADPIILDDVGATYEILPMKQLRPCFEYKVTLKADVSPEAANEPIPYFGWDDNPNLRWIELCPSGDKWLISSIGTGP